MIPDEAVEAAREAAHGALIKWKWSEMDRGDEREFFAAILEAAASHLRAAWRDEELDEKAREAKEEWADEE